MPQLLVSALATQPAHAAPMTNPGKARWALRKAAEIEQQLAALPKADPGDWRARVRLAQTADRLRAEAARFRGMASRWAPDLAA